MLRLLLNILWFVPGSFVMGLRQVPSWQRTTGAGRQGDLVFGGGEVVCFVTIIGIPFGIQPIKLALIALAPIGMQVVPVRH